jgi:hypothetical protein
MKKSTIVLSGLAGFAVFAVAKKISSWVGEQKEFYTEMAEVQSKMAQEEAEEKLAKDKQVFELLAKVAKLEKENKTLKGYSTKEENEELMHEIDTMKPTVVEEAVTKLQAKFNNP